MGLPRLKAKLSVFTKTKLMLCTTIPGLRLRIGQVLRARADILCRKPRDRGLACRERHIRSMYDHVHGNCIRQTARPLCSANHSWHQPCITITKIFEDFDLFAGDEYHYFAFSQVDSGGKKGSNVCWRPAIAECMLLRNNHTVVRGLGYADAIELFCK